MMLRRNDARFGAATASVRPGYVLFAVLVVVVVLSLVAYQYADAMTSQYQAAVRAHEAEQAKAYAVSGIHWAAGCIANPNNVGLDFTDNAGLFSNQPVGDPLGSRGGGRFTIFNLADSGDGTSNYPIRYGLSDESGKLNVNAVILLDPTGQVLHDALMKLPNGTEEIADAIVDWVDSDSTTRPNGAENDVYTGLAQPYRIKNGPINSLEELLLVRGVTPDLLFGADRNRNGQQDASESPGESGFSRGWSEFLTCYGRELNVDKNGVARININGSDAKTLSEQLTAVVGQELSDYILYFRLSGNSQTMPATPAPNTEYVPATNLRDLVQGQIDGGLPMRRRINSTLTIYGTQLPLPRPQGAPPNAPTQLVASPLNDETYLKQILPTLLDQVTTIDDFEMTPRINVNAITKELIAALPGLAETDVSNILAARPAPGSGDDTAAWLVTEAKLNPVLFRSIERYITGRSGAFRVHSVGYSGQPGGPVARVEAVIEYVLSTDSSGQTTGKPRIVYFRDLSDLGRGFSELPR